MNPTPFFFYFTFDCEVKEFFNARGQPLLELGVFSKTAMDEDSCFLTHLFAEGWKGKEKESKGSRESPQKGWTRGKEEAVGGPEAAKRKAVAICLWFLWKKLSTSWWEKGKGFQLRSRGRKKELKTNSACYVLLFLIILFCFCL